MGVARIFQEVRELRRSARNSNFARYLEKNSEVCARYTKGMFQVARKYGVSRKCENTNAWYETYFISSFAALIANKNHVGSIQFVHCLLPMEKVESQMCKKLKVDVNRVASVFHGSDGKQP